MKFIEKIMPFDYLVGFKFHPILPSSLSFKVLHGISYKIDVSKHFSSFFCRSGAKKSTCSCIVVLQPEFESK